MYHFSDNLHSVIAINYLYAAFGAKEADLDVNSHPNHDQRYFVAKRCKTRAKFAASIQVFASRFA